MGELSPSTGEETKTEKLREFEAGKFIEALQKRDLKEEDIFIAYKTVSDNINFILEIPPSLAREAIKTIEQSDSGVFLSNDVLLDENLVVSSDEAFMIIDQTPEFSKAEEIAKQSGSEKEQALRKLYFWKIFFEKYPEINQALELDSMLPESA